MQVALVDELIKFSHNLEGRGTGYTFPIVQI